MRTNSRAFYFSFTLLSAFAGANVGRCRTSRDIGQYWSNNLGSPDYAGENPFLLHDTLCFLFSILCSLGLSFFFYAIHEDIKVTYVPGAMKARAPPSEAWCNYNCVDLPSGHVGSLESMNNKIIMLYPFWSFFWVYSRLEEKSLSRKFVESLYERRFAMDIWKIFKIVFTGMRILYCWFFLK